MNTTLKFAVTAVALATSMAVTAIAQGTAFTYQGRLIDGASPANGTYDLQFAIYDALANGNLVAGPITNASTAINNGLFTVSLDFGPGLFTGASRWVEIGVRTNGGAAFLVLSSRQPLTAAPYAISAGNVAGLLVQPNTNGAPVVIAGSPGNYVTNGVVGATIAGGGATNYLGQRYTNSVTADFGTVGGGYYNTASGLGGTVDGGYHNTAGGAYAIAAGGDGNVASGNYATVSGGVANVASNLYAMVGGGYFNTSAGEGATVSGGEFNLATNLFATIGGGELNKAVGTAGTIAGGELNIVDNAGTVGGGLQNFAGVYAAVSGGDGNSANGQESFIGGGRGNVTYGFWTAIGGGFGNIAAALFSTVGGGYANSTSNSYATVSGGFTNVGAGQYSFIGGGASNTAGLFSQYATVGGGRNNTANTDDSTVGGGRSNNALGTGATVSGGYFDTASGLNSFVGGGYGNGSSLDYATVSGGYFNLATNVFATVPGGYGNIAGGLESFAAGDHALALHQGSFVWSDSQGTTFASAANDTFNIRAQGGVRINDDTSLSFGTTTRQMLNLWGTQYGIGVQSYTMYFRVDSFAPGGDFAWYKGGSHTNNQYNPGTGGTMMMHLDNSGNLYTLGAVNPTSDRNMKQHFEPVDARELLEKVATLPVASWEYKEDASTRHIGPVAQDFYATFHVGTDDKHIATVDADGVALAAIQGLNQKLEQKLEQKETEITQLRQTVAELKQLIQNLDRKLGSN